jgi:hypothetical protein
MYRCVVILRGKRLITDVSSRTRPAGSLWPARAAMAVFQKLIRRSLNSTRSGWQVVAKARAL